MVTKEVYEYTIGNAPRANKYVPKQEVMNLRCTKAAEELRKQKYPIDQIISFTIEFLQKYGLKNAQCEYLVGNNVSNLLTPRARYNKYNEIQRKFQLNSRKHLVWMKFTKSGYLGVVAASDDINFDLTNTSGEIISHLKQDWDKSFILVFPLPNICDKERSDIECGIGNYLIKKDVPILDFYSHRYK
ncbi:predicted protein [Enterococcus gallinarum EG2]|uniref:hypothetical protein n=1 Tax=Enterococcus gallinarum TaxID=1353 RepID=UPI0001B6BB03|nr:hypothetical protein [Enterococcus gallinarum]EEV33781.1 predicted protein [Enterococcus gallinarum EG2]